MYAGNRFLMTSKKIVFRKKARFREKQDFAEISERSLCWFIFVVSHFLGSNLLTRWLHTLPPTPQAPPHRGGEGWTVRT